LNNFIFGLFFCIFALPVLEGLTSLVLTFFEAIKSTLGIWIAHNNCVIEKETPQSQRVIGFSVSEEEEVEDDEL
jgi:hypothetical protein